jgi:membrane protein required for colicin V production
MNTLDIIIAVIFGFCLIRGIFRGLIKEVSSIVGVLAGFYAAYTYYPQLVTPLSRWISNPTYLNILSFLIIFCGVFIVISILGIIIKYLLNSASLGWTDRISGAGFGSIKGILIVSVLLLMLTTFLPKNAPVIQRSLLAPHVMMVSEKMAKVIPKGMREQFVIKIESFKKIWK